MVAVASCSTSNDVTSSISYADVKDWLQKTPEQSGEIWFVICARWFSNFIEQFSEISDTQFSPKKCENLSPIDNSELFDDNGAIRRNLILDMDYRIIPQDCWERLVHEYKIKSGQKPLPVSIIQDGDALGPELYCYQVTMQLKYPKKEIVKALSRTTTLREIEKMMRQEFDVGPDLEARLELQPMVECEWMQIADKSVSLMDTGATEAPVILMDVPEHHALSTKVNGCHEMDGIRVNGSNSPLHQMNDSPLMENCGSLSQHSSAASPPSLATSSAASPAELLDAVIGEDDASSSVLNGGDSGISSNPSTGPGQSGCGPSTLQEHLEQEACFDISSVSMIALPPVNPTETDTAGASNFMFSEPTDQSNNNATSAAIPLPYGPVNQPPDTGAIPLPYGPATLAESGNLAGVVEEEPSEPGACGLRNMVNTCYMNAALQCLSSVKPLAKYFQSEEWEKDVNLDNSLGMQGRLSRAFADLLERLWSGKYKSITPSEIKDLMGEKDKQFVGSRQHDCQELMSAVLDGLHEDLKRSPASQTSPAPEAELEPASDRSIEAIAEDAKRLHRQRENSRIVDLVYGCQKSTVVCSRCGNVSVTFDPFNVLSLPLPGGNLCRLDVTFVPAAQPQPKPVRYTLEVVSSGTVTSLLAKVADVAGTEVARLWAAEVANSRINQPLQPDLPVVSLIDMFSVHVFERPRSSPATPQSVTDSASAPDAGPDANTETDAMDECSMAEPEPEFALQPVVIHMVDTMYSLPFGQPLVYFPDRAPSHMSVEALSEVILRQGARYISRPGPEAGRWWEERPCGPLPPSSPAGAACASSLPDLRPAVAAPMEETATSDQQQQSAPAPPPPPPPPSQDTSEGEEAPPLFTLSEIDEQGARHPLEPGAVVSVPGDRMVRLMAAWHRRARAKFFREAEANSVHYASPAGGLGAAKKSTTLGHCLDLLTSEDLLEGSNAIECIKCPREPDGRPARCAAMKKIDLWELPPVLILHLKRFMYMTQTSKLEIPVEFPISDLCMDAWVKGPQSRGIYDLVAVSNHRSHYLDRGHYTALGRNWRNGRWYQFDDDFVSETEPHLDGELAYILVYVRREDNPMSEVDGDGEDMDIA